MDEPTNEMVFIENKITKEDWKIPCPNHYWRIYEAMKHTKLGTLVNFIEGQGVYNQGWATTITPRGVNVTTTSKTVFVKWKSVLGVYVN